MPQNQFLRASFVGLGALMVAAGAFGAHALKDVLMGDALSWYQTGIRYGMWHVLAGLLYDISTPYQKRVWILYCCLVGIVIFTGTLMIIALTGLKKMGMITPVGGSLFIIFWISWVKQLLHN